MDIKFQTKKYISNTTNLGEIQWSKNKDVCETLSLFLHYAHHFNTLFNGLN